MKIGIVTIYEPVTNLGSYLQAYALKTVLESWGHEVFFVEKTSRFSTIKKCVLKINPKREFWLRLVKAKRFLKAVKKFKLIPQEKVMEKEFDCLIYGSDEIWNLENPYFRDELYWGIDVENVPKIAYAISMGAMEEGFFEQYPQFIQGILNFERILVRDEHTKNIVSKYVTKPLPRVCDPTFLLPLTFLTEDIRLPKKKYLFVYTYGVERRIENIIKEFAKNEDLIIVSACFWHLWVDKVVQCSPLQMSSLIKGAEYVFTTTFHGAVFTMLNHKKCCILPLREKVRDIVEFMHEEEHIIEADCSYENFSETMRKEFAKDVFERRLKDYREQSVEKLKGALECLGK